MRRARTARLGNPRLRLRAGVVLVAFAMSLLVGRLLQLQGLDASAYEAVALRERLHTSALPATRGAITDAGGVALATTVDARNVVADPKLVKEPGRTAAVLAPLLGTSTPGLRIKLSRTDTRFVYLAKQVSPDTWRRIAALELPGVLSETVSKRVYPAGTLAAGVVGFVGPDGRGAGGIEKARDSVLAGRDGKVTFERVEGRQLPTGTNAEVAPVEGRDVRLTIDRDIQWAAQSAIAAKVAETGAQSGTVIVEDPRTGEILALATAPTFDPARPGQSPADDRGNRAVSEVYEPGSTGKVMTAAAAIETGVMTPATVVAVPGSLRRAGKTFHDAEAHGTERLTFAGVLAKSSNIGTILAAERVGFDRLADYLRRFGVGQPSGLAFPGESRGLMPARKSWSGTTPYTLAFGQGYSITSLQGASVFATIANDGVRVTPTIVKGYVDEHGKLTPAGKPAATRVVSAKTAATLRAMLEAVTGEEGTAPKARIPGYRVAGKTGTAQRVDPTCGCYRGYTASFIGFAPADKPALVVSVVLQAPVRGHFGGQVAAPVFRDVMSFALQARKVPPTGTTPATLRLAVATPLPPGGAAPGVRRAAR